MLPAGFRAGGVAAGIKASGRPDLALDRRRPPVRLLRPPCSRRTRSRPRPSGCRGPTSRPRPATPRGGFGWASAVVSTSGCANAATGAAGDADQAEVGRLARRGARCRRDAGSSTSRPGSSARACRSIGSRPGSTRSWATLSGDDAGLAAAAEALRTTDSVTQGRDDDDRRCPADGRRTGTRHGQRHRQGRRDDPPEHGDDALGRADRRGGRARRCSGACCDRPRRGRGTSSRSTATRARTTRSSSSRPGSRGRHRVAAGSGAAAARRGDRGGRAGPRPPAGSRRRGRHDPDHDRR